jgi:hypothetical protein
VIDRRDCIVVVGLVAIHAISVGDVVVAELRVVAAAALQRGHSVCIGQQEPGFGVIKGRRFPSPRVVARLAVRRDPGLLVIWVGSALEIRKVA